MKMSKVSFVILFCLIVVLGTICFSSCFFNNKTHTITFTVDGKEYATMEFNEDDDIELDLPDPPSVKGKNFVRWEYVDDNGTTREYTRYSVGSLKGDTTVYAVFDNNTTNFDVNENGNKIINVRDKSVAVYDIPSQINGIDIDTIDKEVFKDNKNITTVNIPSTIRYIEDSAFENCENLETVTFSNETEELYIKRRAFANCSSIEELVLPDNLTKIYEGSFSGCSSLTKLTTPFLGGGQTYANSSYNAYYTLAYIFGTDETIALKDVVVTKQEFFKYECLTGTSIESIKILSEITEMNRISYYVQDSLVSIDLSNTKLEILPYDAFNGCTKLTSVSLPNTLRKISAYAFCGCSSLETIDLPKSVKILDYSAFAGCEKLKDIDISRVEDIYGTCFLNCPLLTSLDAKSLITIRDNAFKNMPNLTSINLVNVETIGKNAFENDSALVSFGAVKDQLKSLKTIGTEAFKSCSSLSSIYLNKQIESIGDAAFKDCSSIAAFEIEEGSSLSSIGQRSLSGAVSLQSLTIPFVGLSRTSGESLPCLFSRKGQDTAQSGEYTVGNYYVPNSLTSVTITDSTIIPNSAFAQLLSLTSVELSDSVEQIGSGALYGTSLTSFRIPQSLTEINTKIGSTGSIDLYIDSVEHYVSIAQVQLLPQGTLTDTNHKLRLFIGNNEVTSIDLSSMTSLETISDYKFSECRDITSITLPNSVTEIGNYAFYGTGITSITLPTNLTTIKTRAFAYTGLTTIALSPILTNIESAAFAYTSLSSINVPKEMQTIKGFNNISTLASVAFEANSTLQTIGDDCFSGSGLQSITIPASVETIGTRAFKNCSNLQTVAFANGTLLENIGSESFYNTGITSITIPASVENIYSSAFASSDLETITFESNSAINSIGATFLSGTQVSTLVIPSTISTLSNNAFAGMSLLSSVTYPAINTWGNLGKTTGSVSVIVNSSSLCTNAFSSASNVTAIDISNVDTINNNAFYTNWSEDGTSYTGITSLNRIDIASWDQYLSINFGATNSSIPFKYKTGTSTYKTVEIYVDGTKASGSLDLSEIDSAITSIPARAFRGLTGFTSVVLPKTITAVGDYAFAYCSDVTSFKFKEGVNSPTYDNDLTIIGIAAFRGSGISKIVLSNAITTIGANAFSNCTGLTDFSFASSPTDLKLIDNYAFYGCTGITAFTVPASVTTIGNYCFQYSAIQTINFEAGAQLQKTGTGCFSDCADLVTIGQFPSTFTMIGTYTFRGCQSLTTLDFSTSGITSIAESAFRGNTALQYVYLSDKVTSIGNYAFYQCGELLQVIMSGANVVSVGNSAFEDCLKLTTFGYGDWAAVETYVDTNCELSSAVNPDVRDSYINSRKSNFTQIDFVGTKAFKGCESLENVILYSTITSVSSYAFYDCSSLKYVNIPYSCTSIGYMAFAGEAFSNTARKSTSNMTTHEKSLYKTYGIALEFETGITEMVWEYYYNNSMFTRTDTFHRSYYKGNNNYETHEKYHNTLYIYSDCQDQLTTNTRYQIGMRRKSAS